MPVIRVLSRDLRVRRLVRRITLDALGVISAREDYSIGGVAEAAYPWPQSAHLISSCTRPSPHRFFTIVDDFSRFRALDYTCLLSRVFSVEFSCNIDNFKFTSENPHIAPLTKAPPTMADEQAAASSADPPRIAATPGSQPNMARRRTRRKLMYLPR